jgi:hypothetical protein
MIEIKVQVSESRPSVVWQRFSKCAAQGRKRLPDGLPPTIVADTVLPMAAQHSK